MDIDHAVESFFETFKSRLADNFFGSKVEHIFRKITENEKAEFSLQARIFLERSIKYLEERFDLSLDRIYKKFQLLSLKTEELKLTWEVISEFPNKLKLDTDIDIDSLYTEFSCLKAVYNALPKDLPNDEIWAYFFRSDTSSDFVNKKK